MPRHCSVFMIFAVAAVSSVTSARAALATTIPSFQVTGRVAVNEPHSCDGGGGDLTQNVNLSWTECHALKQHMDAAGRPITTNAFVPSALRPLSVTVEVEVWCLYGGGTFGDASPRSTVRVQTDNTGHFRATIPRTSCGLSTPADSVKVRTSALLQFEMDAQNTPVGTIRAIWDKSLGQTVYSSVRSDSEPPLYSDSGKDWVIPRLELQTVARTLPMQRTVNLGNQTFFDGAAPFSYDYLRGALGTWQTVVALHTKLQRTLSTGVFGTEYRRIFITDPSRMCSSCYTLYFTLASSGGNGGAGGFSIDQPVPSPSPGVYGGLVSVGLPAHEFGHSMHGTIASGSMTAADDTMYVTRNLQGIIGGFHTPYVATGTLQQQEMAMALTEGFGDAMGAYFLDGCKMMDRAWGDPDPQRAMWNPPAFTQCDGLDENCPYGAFRLQMLARGIAEGSPVWMNRLAALSALTQGAVAAGAINVISNNELKYRNFFCDLLDADANVAFASGQVGGKTYVSDLAWQAAERLDGRTPSLVFKTYSSDPPPENVQLSLGALLTAMDAFVPDLHTDSPPIPPPLFLAPIVDGANQFYNDTRMSVHGPISPQALGRYLVDRGDLSLDQLNAILRANRMDEVP
jgi:hypothetical protein